MARNEEKQYGRLNRLLLQQQKEEDLKKNPPRPRLGTLSTVQDIQKWLPTIIRDIDFNLKQSQVPCYPERKITELRSEVDRLQREYKTFVRKLKELDPTCEVVPWTERPYSARKRPLNDNDHDKPGDTCPPLKQKVSTDDPGQFEDNSTNENIPESLPNPTERISLPVLDGETEQDYAKEAADVPTVIWNCNPEIQDEPLDFHSYKSRNCSSGAAATRHCAESEPSHSGESDKLQQAGGLNPLGLDYDSSSDDGDGDVDHGGGG